MVAVPLFPGNWPPESAGSKGKKSSELSNQATLSSSLSSDVAKTLADNLSPAFHSQLLDTWSYQLIFN